MSLAGCSGTSSLVENGTWNFLLQREDGIHIPFQVISADSAGRTYLYLANAEEKIRVDSIRKAGDSLLIELPFFDAAFRLVHPKGRLEGIWTKDLGNRVQVMPFSAALKEERFEAPAVPKYDISGRWKTIFTESDGNQTHAVGEFEQSGSYLKGTFLLASGDFRFLEGVVSGDTLKLSTFNGNAAYYFTALIKDDSTMEEGKFYSGPTGMQTWRAVRNDSASIAGEGSGIALKPGNYTLDFTFPSTDGENISINDENFKNKVVVVQLLGSWCPNCMDETAFLSEYYRQHKDKGLEIVALAYERTEDFEKSVKAVSSFRKRLNVTYPVLITGVAVSDTLRTEKTLPQLNKISYFPTTIILDKKGVVRKIHEGFTGPGTGEHYTKYIHEFDALIQQLLSE